MTKSVTTVVLALETEMVFVIKSVKMTREQFSQVESLLDEIQEINEEMEGQG